MSIQAKVANDSKKSRLPNPQELVPELQAIGKAMYGATLNGSVSPTTISLIQLRAGQLAGNTYLVVLHTNSLNNAGEAPERIAAVASWRDAPYYTDAERIALALTEAVLLPSAKGERVSDELFSEAAGCYGTKALATLAMAIGQVNFFTPLAVIGKPLPGRNQAEQWTPVTADQE